MLFADLGTTGVLFSVRILSAFCCLGFSNQLQDFNPKTVVAANNPFCCRFDNAGGRPDVIGINSAISACAKAGWWQLSLETGCMLRSFKILSRSR